VSRIVKRQVGELLTRQRKVLWVYAGISALIFLLMIDVSTTSSLAQSSPLPKWDEVSIKPCDADNASAASGRGRGSTPPASFSPLRMTLNCQSPVQYIQYAYLLFPNGQNPPSRLFSLSTSIEGAPDWTRNQRYRIEAITDVHAMPQMMEGPMLQALLEDRFKLKLHREVRDVPVYDLVVAKGGPKLTPFVEGSCTPFSMDNTGSAVSSQPQTPEGQKKYCRRGMGGHGGNYTILDDATTLDLLCKDFLNSVGDDHRRVINKNGPCRNVLNTFGIFREPGGSRRDARTRADAFGPNSSGNFHGDSRATRLKARAG
jgi:uncharacterized protein (TIGR03435 family)